MKNLQRLFTAIGIGVVVIPLSIYLLFWAVSLIAPNGEAGLVWFLFVAAYIAPAIAIITIVGLIFWLGTKWNR